VSARPRALKLGAHLESPASLMRWQLDPDRPPGAALACGQLRHPYAKLNAPRDAPKVPT
jgi:hypothetical protein